MTAVHFHWGSDGVAMTALDWVATVGFGVALGGVLIAIGWAVLGR